MKIMNINIGTEVVHKYYEQKEKLCAKIIN
jgi:hypothetical protein